MTSLEENEKGTTVDDSSTSQYSQRGEKNTPASSNSSDDDIEPGTSSTSTQAVKDPNIVDWDGPLDPQNPLNWATSKKITAIALVASITFLSPLTSTMIAPGTESVMADFKSTSSTLASFITSSYLLGYAFGPLVLAPLSEIYGRLLVYHTCNTLFLIFNIACAVAPNLVALIVFRTFAGIAGSCPVTIGAGSIADMIPHEKRGLAMAAWLLGPLLGPSIGPLAGGYLTMAKGWRWNFWVLSIAIGSLTIITFALMRESYAPAILSQKAKRLRKSTGNLDLISALQSPHSPSTLLKISIIRPLKMLFMSPIIFLLSLYTAIVYAYLYLLFTTFPSIFSDQYGFSEGSSGLAYLGIGVGSMIGLAIAGAISDKLVKALTEKNGGTPKPEYRLPTMIVGGFVIPIGLFMYGWTAEAKVHWILPIIGTAFLGGGMMIAFLATSTYLIDAYTIYAASVTAASTVFRSLCGALLPLAGGAMYDRLGVGWGTSVLAFISVGFLPMPFVFWFYGQRIRESKRFRVEF